LDSKILNLVKEKMKVPGDKSLELFVDTTGIGAVAPPLPKRKKKR
jgi:hypothetical protein